MTVLSSNECVVPTRLLADAWGELVCLVPPSCEEAFPAGGRPKTPASETHFALVPQGGVAEAVEEAFESLTVRIGCSTSSLDDRYDCFD